MKSEEFEWVPAMYLPLGCDGQLFIPSRRGSSNLALSYRNSKFGVKQAGVSNIRSSSYLFSGLMHSLWRRTNLWNFSNIFAVAIECVRSCDQKPYLHNETKGGICIKIEFNSQKKILLLQYGRRFFVYSSNMAAVTSYKHTLFDPFRLV